MGNGTSFFSIPFNRIMIWYNLQSEKCEKFSLGARKDKTKVTERFIFQSQNRLRTSWISSKLVVSWRLLSNCIHFLDSQKDLRLTISYKEDSSKENIYIDRYFLRVSLKCLRRSKLWQNRISNEVKKEAFFLCIMVSYGETIKEGNEKRIWAINK